MSRSENDPWYAFRNKQTARTYSQDELDAAVAAERERCIAECKAVAADVTDAAKMGALECWRRLALGA